MSINYQLHAADFDAGARYLMKNHSIIRRQFIRTEITALVTAIVMVLILPYFVFREQYLLTVLISAVLMTVYFIWFRYYIRQSYIKRFTKISTDNNPQFSRNVSLQLTENGISSQTELGTGELFWSAIQRVDQDDTYIYLVLSSPNLMMIPRDKFQSPDACNSFIQVIAGRISNK